MSQKSFNTFIELHLIQNFSPSNLNRDDTGSPKDCEFGGYRRARISSQALKRAIRNHPRFEALTDVDNGTRSKKLTEPIIKALVEQYGRDPELAETVAIHFVSSYAAKMDSKKPDHTSVLIFYTASEVEKIVAKLQENWDAVIDKNDGKKLIGSLANDLVKQTKDRTSAPDVALFGRMLASTPELNIDAASQVSHAISTHRVAMEMDYYTAVDELNKNDEAGAGMVGFTGFNSACFYRYARIDFNLLNENLDSRELAQRTVHAFLRSAIDAIPTGKQNAFAAQNPTSFALAVVRQDGMSWNLANSFETPIKANKGKGYVSESILNLDQLWGALTRFYDDAEVSTISAYSAELEPTTLTHLEDNKHETVSAWLAPINQALATG
ncbi:MAG: type I-E CRISPR-associated protein Cas7/Cse4/CasC [Chloroflexota bacterium]